MTRNLNFEIEQICRSFDLLISCRDCIFFNKIIDTKTDLFIMDNIIESGKQKVSLLQVASNKIESQFLLKHVWQSPFGLENPFKSTEILKLLLDQPYHFYLTPMGFNSTIKSLHVLYVLAIFIFMANRIYLDDSISHSEWSLWTLNIGYVTYELIEAYNKGIRDYLVLSGWINYWDLQTSLTWIVLFGVRNPLNP